MKKKKENKDRRGVAADHWALLSVVLGTRHELWVVSSWPWFYYIYLYTSNGTLPKLRSLPEVSTHWVTKPGCGPKLLWLRSSFHVCISKLLAKEGALIHSFPNSGSQQLALEPLPWLVLGKRKMNRTQQCHHKPDSVHVLGLLAYSRSSQGRVVWSRFCTLSQSNENCWITHDDEGTACSMACKTQGAALSLPSSLCHLLSSVREFNLEPSQGEGGRTVRGHLNST